jgi:two-component system, LytTR family, sensor kinase
MTSKSNQKKWVSLLAWLGLYVFWVMVFQKRELALAQTATIEFCYIVFIAANFYFITRYAIPNFLHRRKHFVFVLLVITGVLVTAILRVPLATYLNKYYYLVGKPQPDFSTIFSNSLLNISIWVTLLVAGRVMIDRFQFQQYLEEVTKQKEQAELDFLNAQFNPHFLFNSINSIYGHIDKQNVTARNMLLTFSEMLRYQLYDCNSSSIAIDKEMNYIRNYVALQKARKDESLSITLSIDENVKGFSIAPLLFIAFIENCFKYLSSSDERDNKVIISLTKEDQLLRFKCYNTKETVSLNGIEHKGIGISNAKRRLQLLYPEKHWLDIKNENDFYEVNLTLNVA